MNWLDQLLVHRAAGRYARLLPRALIDGWGGSKTYTPDQIAAGVKAVGLNPRYIGLAYAAYLPEDTYVALQQSLPLPLAYGGARAVYKQHLPWESGSAWENPKGATIHLEMAVKADMALTVASRPDHQPLTQPQTQAILPAIMTKLVVPAAT